MAKKSDPDSLIATGVHEDQSISTEDAIKAEREAGARIFKSGGTLPNNATTPAHEGFFAAQDEADGKGVETIQGGDIQTDPPAGATPAPGPTVVHRPLTKANLVDHARAIAKAVCHLESDLAVIGLAEGEEVPEKLDFDSLPEGEKDARVAEAAMFVGNAVYGQPETEAFRPNVIWAVARALRPKLVMRHHASTPDVG